MSLAFLVPGPLDQLTGGYLFDRQVVDGLRQLGRTMRVFELPGHFPAADEIAFRAAGNTLAALPDNSTAVIDGLALPAFAECLAREARRLQLIGFIHHPLSVETGLSAAEAARYVALEATLWPLLHGALCPGRQTAQALIAAGVPADRVIITQPGTTKPAPFHRSPATPLLQLLAVGTITPRKGHLLLLKALAGLRDLDWHLTCIGSLERDPATSAAVQRSLADLQLLDRVTLTGECLPARLAAAYRDADLFVLPSYQEGYGMVYAEALAHGLPVIATTAGAIPDTVPATASLLVPPGDFDALRGALRRLLTDTALRAQLAAGAARAGEALPDWATAVSHWAGALDRLAP